MNKYIIAGREYAARSVEAARLSHRAYLKRVGMYPAPLPPNKYRVVVVYSDGNVGLSAEFRTLDEAVQSYGTMAYSAGTHGVEATPNRTLKLIDLSSGLTISSLNV